MALNPLIIGIILSMLPIAEIRGGIPYAIAGGINPVLALITGFFANILIIIPVWFFLDHVHNYLLNIGLYKRASDRVLERMRHKAAHVKKKMEVLEWFALTLFVAVPLPITGAYTGSIVVWLLGLNRKKSFMFISLGVLIAAIIVTLATLGVISLFN